MSTPGSPGGFQKFSKPTPPQRGSFPLDHEAECQAAMKEYLRCIKRARGINSEECRLLSKGYLECRMDRELMARDSTKNLGFADLEEGGKNGLGQGEKGIAG